MKRSLLCICVIVVAFMTSACGYTFQDTQRTVVSTPLGVGDKTLVIANVEQAAITPWIPYYLRLKVHQEATLRKLGKWGDSEDADYFIHLNIPNFQTEDDVQGEEDVTILSSANMSLEMDIFDSQNKLIWSSGLVRYEETYQYMDSDETIKTIVDELVYMVFDRLQQKF